MTNFGQPEKFAVGDSPATRTKKIDTTFSNVWSKFTLIDEMIASTGKSRAFGHTSKMPGTGAENEDHDARYLQKRDARRLFARGSGTLNYLSKWTPSGTELGNSIAYDTGTRIGVGTTSPETTLHVVKEDSDSTSVSYPLRITHRILV